VETQWLWSGGFKFGINPGRAGEDPGFRMQPANSLN